jgi:hypothetical protein
MGQLPYAGMITDTFHPIFSKIIHLIFKNINLIFKKKSSQFWATWILTFSYTRLSPLQLHIAFGWIFLGLLRVSSPSSLTRIIPHRGVYLQATRRTIPLSAFGLAPLPLNCPFGQRP